MQPQKNTMQQTLQQRRAKQAWEDISQLRNWSEDDKKKYGSLARSVPAMIQTDGLGPALAFLKAKSKIENGRPKHPEFWWLNQHISIWVLKHMGVTGNDLLIWLLAQTSVKYRQATTEALAYAGWLKRFAEGEGWANDSTQLDRGE